MICGHASRHDPQVIQRAVENYLRDVDKPLVVPTGVKIRVLLTANDVIHAWWVPDFGMKRDATQVNNTNAQLGFSDTFQNQSAGIADSSAARNQYLAEQQALRDQPINEITALMHGGQVSGPNWVSNPQTSIASPNYEGDVYNSYNAQMQAYNTQVQQQSAQNGGIAAGVAGPADEGVKNLATGVDQLVRQMRAEQQVVRQWVDEQSAQQSEVAAVLKDLAQTVNRGAR